MQLSIEVASWSEETVYEYEFVYTDPLITYCPFDSSPPRLAEIGKLVIAMSINSAYCLNINKYKGSSEIWTCKGFTHFNMSHILGGGSISFKLPNSKCIDAFTQLLEHLNNLELLALDQVSPVTSNEVRSPINISQFKSDSQ